MPLFYCEYTILDHTRFDYTAYFGGMTAADDQSDQGENVVLLGRWSTVGESSGCSVCVARDAKALNDWLYNWNHLATCVVWPILDDNHFRTLLLAREGMRPEYQISYNEVNREPAPGESLYWIKFKFHDGKRLYGQMAFASMSEEEYLDDVGDNVCLGRWHNLGLGSGVAICLSRSESDLYKWALNWCNICDWEIKPVVHDNEYRDVIRNKPTFAKQDN